MPRTRLAATSKPGRILLGVAAGLALVAVVAVSTGLRTEPAVRVRTVLRPPDQVIALDPVGCPLRAQCQLRPTVPESLTTAVRRAFPQADPQWQTTTVDQTGQAHRYFAVFALDGDRNSLVVTAECRSGSTHRTSRREVTTAQQRSDLAGNQIAELTVHEIVVPGAAGCSADLVVSAVGDGSSYNQGLRSLAADRAVQVRA